jgi:signal transduction histidine kinase
MRAHDRHGFLRGPSAPAEDRADHVVEILGNARGPVRDGFEFLYLAKLVLEGAPFGDVLDNPFELVGGRGEVQITEVKFDGEAAIPAAPFGLSDRRAFRRIRGQADRAAELTREPLAIGRRQTLQPQTVDLNSIISNLAIFLEKVIGSDIDVQLQPGDRRPIHADPSQIEHVLIILCLNARDAMPKGGRLQISGERRRQLLPFPSRRDRGGRKTEESEWTFTRAM